jgi:hypothetical protein
MRVCEMNKRQASRRNVCKKCTNQKCEMSDLILEKMRCYLIVIVETIAYSSFVINVKSLLGSPYDSREMNVVDTGGAGFQAYNLDGISTVRPMV